jgi:hypothetical protein
MERMTHTCSPDEVCTCNMGQVCQWFALCPNDATHTLAHPILGDVPICDRCQAKYDAS